MKAIQLQTYGGPEALRVSEIAIPHPAPGQVLVKVWATSLNPIDPIRASGALKATFPLRFPFVPGGDFSGVVDAVGEGVTGWRPGDAVYGHSIMGGAYAERIAVDGNWLEKKPSNLTHVEAAAIAVVGQTAMQAVEATGLRAGQTILVHGAGGAVGGIAVQLAHRAGATVLATASAADAARVVSYGASTVLGRGEPIEAPVGGVDAVIDAVGGQLQNQLFAHIKPNGVLVALNQPPSQEEAERHGIRALMIRTETSRQSLSALRDLVEAGEVLPHVADTASLWHVEDVWRRYVRGALKGKIVFTT